MLSPRGEAPSLDGPLAEPLDMPLDMPLDAVVERLRRRVGALERQLDARIEEVASLRARLAEQEARTGEAQAQAAQARHAHAAIAAEHEALLNTLTMRVLRRPRDWYGAVRRLRRRERPLP